MLTQLAEKQKLVFFFDDLQWADNITISLIQDILTSAGNRNILFLFTCKGDKRPFIDSFLEEMSAAQPEEIKFQFTHQKILEYVYGELSATKKQILHNKTACCLEGRLKNNDSDLLLYSKLMYHFQRARNQKKYLKYYIEYVYSYLNRSHEYYPIIINYQSQPCADTPDIACTDNEGISRILHDIRALVNQNIDSFSDEDCQGFLSDYYHMMGRYYIRKVEYDKGLHYIRKLIALNRGRSSQRCHINMIKANRQLICVYLNRYETQNLREVIQESFQLLQNIYKAEEEAIWKRLSGLCGIMAGDIGRGIEDLRSAISIFERSEERERYLYNLAASYAWLGEAERSQMHYDKAREYYDHAIGICEENFLVGGTATFYTYAGQAAFDSGDLAQAEAYLSLAVRQFSAVELMWGRGVAFGYYGLLCIRRGDYQAAFDYLTKAECFAQRLESCYEHGMLNRIYGQIALEMQTNPKLKSIFAGYLDQSVEVYVRRARKLLQNVHSPVDQMYLDRLSGESDTLS